MDTIPTQTLDTSHLGAWNPEGDQRDLRLQIKESRWWNLAPGEPGYDQPLHAYLGFTEEAWRCYAISERRTR